MEQDASVIMPQLSSDEADDKPDSCSRQSTLERGEGSEEEEGEPHILISNFS